MTRLKRGAGASLVAGVFLTGVAGACCAPAALAADSVYWTNSQSPGALRVGNLDGTGSAQDLFTGESGPSGVAIDPAAGKIYWSDGGAAGAIRVGNLDGSGSAQTLFTGESVPTGIAIDPAAGKIYWTDWQSGTVRVGNLNGSGSAQTLYTGVGGTGVAIDPAAGKIYWADDGAGTIRVGNLDGTGSPQNLYTGQTMPVGVAIDPAAGKIYWADDGPFGAGTIRVGNLSGSGSPQTLYAGGTSPEAVAIDPAAGKIYWADAVGGALNGGFIFVGNLNGSGSPKPLISGENYPSYLALLRSPQGTAAPQLSGGTGLGSPLVCSQGQWASDLSGALLYRAPRRFAYQWTRNGTDIAGAMSTSYTPSTPGSYTCRVTASNQAGSTAQTSSPAIVSAPAASTPAATSQAPVVSGATQSHRRWREGTRLATPSVVPRVPVGTTFSFVLNERAAMSFAFGHQVTGRNVGGRCVAENSNNRRDRACERTISERLSVTAHSGLNRLFFRGSISATKKLTPGHYTVNITATNGEGQRSKAMALTFTIVA
jgi:hypothetical protein